MKRLQGQRIAVGLSGGIAAYRACDLIRGLYREGAEQVVALMTPGAGQFITPLTLESLTRQPVYRDAFENTSEGIPVHIALAQAMDALVIVPATANTLAKLAHGMSDNMVTTTALTFTGKPVVLAPAMNTRMWDNPLMKRNLAILTELDHMTMIQPDAGELACGEIGEGKLADTETLLFGIYCATHPNRGLYQGKKILVSAGGTREPLDAVRYLSNRGSGKMGIALADELYAMGAEVMLVHTGGPLNRPYGVFSVESADNMFGMIDSLFPEMDGLIMAAAVSDFRPAPDSPFTGSGKVKKQDQLALELIKTVDILETMGRQKQPRQFLIGFAAEHGPAGMASATEKLRRKNLDMLVFNDIAAPGIGFGSDENAVTLLFPDRSAQAVDRAEKWQIARRILTSFISQPQVAATL